MKCVRVGRSQRRVRVEGRQCHDWMAVDLGKLSPPYQITSLKHVHYRAVVTLSFIGNISYQFEFGHG